MCKTAWEMKQKILINMAANRGVFIDQSQSFSVLFGHPDVKILTAIHFHEWKNGLKTGIYYLRTKPAASAIQFTVDQTKLKNKEKAEADMCYLINREVSL